MEEAISGEQNAPRPEHAKRAIWAGRAARSRTAASTDRGRASNSGCAGSALKTILRGADPKVAAATRRKALDTPEVVEATAELREAALSRSQKLFSQSERSPGETGRPDRDCAPRRPRPGFTTPSSRLVRGRIRTALSLSPPPRRGLRALPPRVGVVVTWQCQTMIHRQDQTPECVFGLLPPSGRAASTRAPFPFDAACWYHRDTREARDSDEACR